MTRFDLYGPVHKGLRGLLFETATLLARTEFTDEREHAAALAAVRRTNGFLHAHLEHEDHDVMPHVQRLAPELYADLEADHARITGCEQEIVRLVERLAGAPQGERAALGRRLVERFTRLVAEHVLHMEREEAQANRVFWAHFDDAALAALEGRIVASIPPSEVSHWMTLMLPSISRGERAQMLARMAAAVPPEVLVQLTAEARWRIGPEEWTATQDLVVEILAQVEERASAR
ncbi:MAG: hemerythrin domain-containing protein [Planctomycetes bacterium]|nr:hemerythrin domain-containing protein [Planctomycetota bacterium]